MNDDFVPYPWPTTQFDIPVPIPWAKNRRIETDGGAHVAVPIGYSETIGRATCHARRVGTSIFINVCGDVPNLQTIADIRPLPWKIHPQQFGVFFYTPNQPVSPALRSFNFTEQFGFPSENSEVVIHDSDGAKVIPIIDSTSAMSLVFQSTKSDSTKPVKTGFGKTIEEAMEQAIAQLPSTNPDVADGYIVYSVTQLGRFKGGFVGLDRHYVTVEANFTKDAPLKHR